LARSEGFEPPTPRFEVRRCKTLGGIYKVLTVVRSAAAIGLTGPCGTLRLQIQVGYGGRNLLTMRLLGRVKVTQINKRFIDTHRCEPGKQNIHWDDALPAFGVQCSAKTGRPVTYVCQGRIDARPVRRKIGRVDVITLAKARDEARDMLHGFRKGIDPKVKKAAGATLGQTLDAYIEANVNLKPRSVEFYRSTVERHLPDWLDLPVASITRDMTQKRHRQIAADVEARDRAENAKRAKEHLVRAERAEKHWPESAERHRMKWQAAKGRKPRSGHGIANGTMRCLRALMNFEIDKENPIIAANPVRLKRRWYKVDRRKRSVEDPDLPKFYSAVMVLKNEVHRHYILLLLFSGLRRREAAGLRWADIDMKTRIIRVRDTKANRPLDLPMCDVIYDMLAARRAIGNTTFVFPANSKSGHIEEPKFALAEVEEACGVKISVHDLRRTFTTVAESANIPVIALKALVNHSLGNGVTEGYINMSVERLREPAQRVADKLKMLCGITKRRRVAG